MKNSKPKWRPCSNCQYKTGYCACIENEMPKFVEMSYSSIDKMPNVTLTTSQLAASGDNGELERALIAAGFNQEISNRASRHIKKEWGGDITRRQANYAEEIIRSTYELSKNNYLVKEFPHNRWKQLLGLTLAGPNMANISRRLVQGEFSPGSKVIFRAFRVEKPKVIILGQDPYPGDGVADGLAFSTPNKVTASFKNIVKELYFEYGPGAEPSNGDLTGWSVQHVMLLNTILTIGRGGESHKDLGWQKFTHHALEVAQREYDPIFVGFGSDAEKALRPVEKQGATVLVTSHPSSRSAHLGFLGSNIFKRVNDLLMAKGQKPINWLKIGNRTDA